MKLECVQVSVGYADYLAASLPHNKALYDRMIVMTSPTDAATQRVCNHYHVECVPTDLFYADGAAFNKGAAIDLGLRLLDFQEWAIVQDGDLVLPPLTRRILTSIELNEQFLYGIDRLMVPSVDHWVRFMANPLSQHECAYVYVGPFPVGVRVTNRGGWLPIGFFQMFHRQSAFLGTPFYPQGSQNAATSDTEFALRWPRTHRHLLPEFLGYHLATADVTNGKMGQNWEGRRTARFEVPDQYHPNTHRPEVVSA